MNITEFKRLVNPANEAESKRLSELTSRHLKHTIKHLDLPEPTRENTSKVWQSLNKQFAKEDKFHKQQTHEMRNFKGGFEDYSDMAYNNSSDDL